VRQQDVKPYSPANHTGTRNFRLIGPETVAAKQVEVLVGELERGKGALPHSAQGDRAGVLTCSKATRTSKSAARSSR